MYVIIYGDMFEGFQGAVGTFESKEEYTSGSKSPSFVSIILLDEEEKGTGRGDSKKEAEQQAAKVALKSIHKV